MSKCLMIVGMHRSGTSLLASMLQKAGLFIGEELLHASKTNKKGYFENTAFLNFQKKAFESLSLDTDGWDLQSIESLNTMLDQQAKVIIQQNTKEEWGWKDPRTTLFLRYWENKIPNIKYIFVYRDPWDVVDSLFRRGSDQKILAEPAHAFKAWNFYNREIISMYKKHKEDSIIIHTDDVIKNIYTIIEEVNTRFGFHLKHEAIETIFDETLYKSSKENLFYAQQIAVAYPEVIDTLNELRSLSGKEAFQVTAITANELSEKMTTLFMKRWQEMGMLNLKIRNLEEEIKGMKTSAFWKAKEFFQRTKR